MNRCPTCKEALRSALAACQNKTCLAEEQRVEAWHKRGEDQ